VLLQGSGRFSRQVYAGATTKAEITEVRGKLLVTHFEADLCRPDVTGIFNYFRDAQPGMRMIIMDRPAGYTIGTILAVIDVRFFDCI